MSTHVPRFDSFFQVFKNHFVLAKLATSSIRVKLSIIAIVRIKCTIC